MRVLRLSAEKCADAVVAVDYAMAELPRGEELKVVFGQRDWALDLADLANARGYEVVSSGEEDAMFYVILRKP